jgi:hypothetical protein
MPASRSPAWTGNDARIVEYTVDELEIARDKSMIRDIVDHGLTSAGSRSWLIKKVRNAPKLAFRYD